MTLHIPGHCTMTGLSGSRFKSRAPDVIGGNQPVGGNMSDECRNCGRRIVQIITEDGVGWYHPLPDKPNGNRHVRESCNLSGVGLPFADPT